MRPASRTAIAIWLALLAGCALLAARTPVTTDFTGFLPLQIDAQQRLLVHQLRDGVAARLMLVGTSGGEPGQLADASRGLAERMQASGLFAYVSNGEDRYAKPDRDLIARYRYLLSPAVAPEHFSAAALRGALEDAIRQLGSPLGAALAAMLPADPTGELTRILQSLPAGGPQTREGVWFSADGKRALLLAQTRALASDLDAQQRAVAAVQDAFDALPSAGSLSLALTGPGAYAVKSRALIQADATRSSSIAGVAVLGILLFVYRSARITLLCFLPILSGMLAGFALVGVTFGVVHAITLGFAATLIGEAVDYPSYLFIHNQPGDTLEGTLVRIWPTLRLAVLTTVLGGLTMLLSSFTGLAQLGLLLMTGVFVAGLVTRYVLPAIASARPVALEPVMPLLAWSAATRWQRSVRVLGWAGCAAALAAIALYPGRLWDDDLGNLSPIAEADKRLDQQLRAELKAPDVRSVIVVRAADREQVLRQTERLDPLLRELVREKRIEGFEMASHFLPSAERQDLRRSALPDSPSLRKALAEAVAGLPFREGLFEPFIRDVEAARTGAPLDVDAMRGTALHLKIETLLFPLEGEWIALIPLRGLGDRAAVLARLAAAGVAGATLLDLRAEAAKMIERYRLESLRLSGAGIAAMLLLLLWGLGSFAQALRVLLPVLLAVVIEAGIFLISAKPLTVFHLVSLLFVVGTGLNYSLFFSRAPHDPDERRRTLLAITVCFAATVAAAACLALSDTPVLHAIGLTVLLGNPLTLLLAAAFGRYSH